MSATNHRRVVLPHVTRLPDGTAHIQLPSSALALHEELRRALPPGAYTLYDGWSDFVVDPAATTLAVAIIRRRYVHADYGGPCHHQ